MFARIVGLFEDDTTSRMHDVLYAYIRRQYPPLAKPDARFSEAESRRALSHDDVRCVSSCSAASRDNGTHGSEPKSCSAQQRRFAWNDLPQILFGFPGSAHAGSSSEKNPLAPNQIPAAALLITLLSSKAQPMLPTHTPYWAAVMALAPAVFGLFAVISGGIYLGQRLGTLFHGAHPASLLRNPSSRILAAGG